MTGIPTWQCVVAGLLQRADGLVLMHRRPLHKDHGGLWEFPGGKVEADEIPRKALLRELAEELAISVDEDDLRPAAFAEEREQGGRKGIVILLYSVGAWSGDPVAQEEGAEVGWFLPDDLSRLARPPLDVLLCQRVFRSDAGTP